MTQIYTHAFKDYIPTCFLKMTSYLSQEKWGSSWDLAALEQDDIASYGGQYAIISVISQDEGTQNGSKRPFPLAPSFFTYMITAKGPLDVILKR